MFNTITKHSKVRHDFRIRLETILEIFYTNQAGSQLDVVGLLAFQCPTNRIIHGHNKRRSAGLHRQTLQHAQHFWRTKDITHVSPTPHDETAKHTDMHLNLNLMTHLSDPV
jgi:hypothetical protein